MKLEIPRQSSDLRGRGINTHLFMRREDGKSSASRLVLLGGPQGPEGDGTAAKLGKPALEFRLGCIVGKARHVQNLATLREKSPNICTSIHGTSQHVGMLVSRLRLPDKPPKDTGKCNSFLHSPARRGWGQSLQMERQIVLDGSTGLNSLNLKGGADVGQRGGSEGQRLGVVLLPSLVFRAEVKSSRVLEVRRQNHSFVSGFPGQLNPQIPGIERDEDEIQILGCEVLGGEGIEAIDCVPESASVSNVLPCEGGQARW